MKTIRPLAVPLIPSVYAITWLVYYTISGNRFWDILTSHDIMMTHMIPPVLMLFVLIIIFIISVFPVGIKESLKELILHSPLFLSPLAVTGQWAMIGAGFGDYGTFIHWLTRYPNMGPLNYEVLLGMICVLGASFIPVVFAVYHLLSMKRAIILATILIFDLILYGAVFAKLDFDSLYVCQCFIYLPIAIGGPVLRMVPIPFMIYFTLISIKSHCRA